MIHFMKIPAFPSNPSIPCVKRTRFHGIPRKNLSFFLARLLEAMKEAGYDVGDLPEDLGRRVCAKMLSITPNDEFNLLRSQDFCLRKLWF